MRILGVQMTTRAAEQADLSSSSVGHTNSAKSFPGTRVASD